MTTSETTSRMGWLATRWLALLALGCGPSSPPLEEVDAGRARRDAAGEDAATIPPDGSMDAAGAQETDAARVGVSSTEDAHMTADVAHRDAGPRVDVGACEATDAGERCPCVDSRDCEAGQSCEEGACVPRRVGCRPVEGFDCPWGFVCDTTGATFVCRRTLLRCFDDAQCEPGWRCLDTNGDGDAECIAEGVCRARGDCADGLTCATRPAERFASCERFGACGAASDCAAGMECRDLWGDGVRECVEPGGCASNVECGAGAICATPPEGGPPSCLARPPETP